MNDSYVNEIENYFNSLKCTIDMISKEDLDALMHMLEKTRNEGKNIFIMGNGGSAATASHFVCDFNKGISDKQEKKYRFICLNDNVPSMMAYANDVSYDEVFVGSLKNLFRPGDVVIGISGSGNSENVVRALEYANQHNGITVALTGFDGGKLKRIAEYNVHIPIYDMQVTEDLHMMLDHCMMKILSHNKY